MIDFARSDQQRLLIDTIRRFIREELAPLEDEVERWLRPAVRGDLVCSIAITEPYAGSDAAGITTRATLEDRGRCHLSGHKHFISNGLVSDFSLVSAVTGEAEGRKEISLFLVDKGLQGCTLGRDQPMMGLRGTSHAELWIDDVVLDAERLLGERGLGFRMAMDVLGRVVDRAVQIFGGMGYCKDLPVARWYRDARIFRIFDGAPEIHRGVIARSLARRGASVFDLNR